MLGGVFATLPTGYLIDRIGRRKMLIAGPLITAVSAFLSFIATSYLELLLYLSIGGIPQQIWQMSRLAAIADSGAPQSRGRMITGMAGVNRTGIMVGPILGGIIGEFYGLRTPFLMFGIASLLATVPSYLLIKETAPTVLARRRGEDISSNATSWSKLLTRSVIVLFAAQFLANVGRGGVQGQSGIYVIFAAYAYGLGSVELGGLITAMGFVSIPVTLTAGQIMDRFGRKRTIVPASATLGIGLFFMAGSMQTLGSDIAPAEARGKFFGVNRLIAEAGSMSNPGVFIIATATIAGGVGFGSAFLIMAVCALSSSSLVGFLLRETLTKVKK